MRVRHRTQTTPDTTARRSQSDIMVRLQFLAFKYHSVASATDSKSLLFDCFKDFMIKSLVW